MTSATCTSTMEEFTSLHQLTAMADAGTGVKGVTPSSSKGDPKPCRGLCQELPNRERLFQVAFENDLIRILCRAIPELRGAKSDLESHPHSFRSRLWRWHTANLMAWMTDLLRKERNSLGSLNGQKQKSSSTQWKICTEQPLSTSVLKFQDALHNFDFKTILTQASRILQQSDRALLEGCFGDYDYEWMCASTQKCNGPMFQISRQTCIAADDPHHGFFTPGAHGKNTVVSSHAADVMQVRESARAFLQNRRNDPSFKELLKTIVFLGRTQMDMLADLSHFRDPCEYMGPFRLMDIPGRGAGIVMVGHVSAGHLLIAQRAMFLGSTHDEVEEEIEHAVHISAKSGDKGFNTELNTLEFQTRTWSERLGRDECHECACGRHFQCIQKSSRTDVSEPMRIAKIEELCLRRCFGFNSVTGREEFSDSQFSREKTSDECAGLWPAPAGLIQHSCAPNSTREHIGSMLFIRAAVDLQPGDIVTANYVGYSPAPFDYITRRSVLRDWAIMSCQCPLCTFQASIPVGLMKRFQKLQNKATRLANRGVALMKKIKQDGGSDVQHSASTVRKPGQISSTPIRAGAGEAKEGTHIHDAEAEKHGHEINQIAAILSHLANQAIRLHGVALPDIHSGAQSLIQLAERMAEGLLATNPVTDYPRPFLNAATKWGTSERTVATSIALFLSAISPFLQILYTNQTCQQCHIEHRSRKAAICALEFILTAGLWKQEHSEPRVSYAPDDYLADVEKALKDARKADDKGLVQDLERLQSHLEKWSRSKAAGGDCNFRAATEVGGLSQLNHFGSAAASLGALFFLDRKCPDLVTLAPPLEKNFSSSGSTGYSGFHYKQSVNQQQSKRSDDSTLRPPSLDLAFEFGSAVNTLPSGSKQEALCRAAAYFTRESFSNAQLRRIKLWIEMTKLADRMKVSEEAFMSWKETYADLETVEQVCSQDGRWAQIHF